MFFKNEYSMKFFDKVFSTFDNRHLNVESIKETLIRNACLTFLIMGSVSNEFKKKVINLSFHVLGVVKIHVRRGAGGGYSRICTVYVCIGRVQ